MKLVKVRMLGKGPNKNYEKGQIVEVDEMRAAILVEFQAADDSPKALSPKYKPTDEKPKEKPKDEKPEEVRPDGPVRSKGL